MLRLLDNRVRTSRVDRVEGMLSFAQSKELLRPKRVPSLRSQAEGGTVSVGGAARK